MIVYRNSSIGGLLYNEYVIYRNKKDSNYGKMNDFLIFGIGSIDCFYGSLF